MKRLLLSISCFVVVGCSNPENVLIPRDSTGHFNSCSTEKFKDAIEKLEKEDRALLASYIYFMRFGGEAIPEGFRIRDAVDLMRSFRQTQYGVY